MKSVTGARRPRAAPRRPRRPLPDFSKWGAVEVKPMSNIRRKTAEHLSVAWQAPHVTQHDKADVTALEEFRKAYGPRVEKAGGKLTVTAILIKIVAAGDRALPAVRLVGGHGATSRSCCKKYRHIGVAVDTPNGLLVPVIRDVDRKTITEIAVELATLSQKARDKKLSLDEMSGGVFSITQPRRHRRHVVHADRQPAGSRDPRRVARRRSSRCGTRRRSSCRAQMLPLSLSYDHRVIDGADAARFLRFVAEGARTAAHDVL